MRRRALLLVCAFVLAGCSAGQPDETGLDPATGWHRPVPAIFEGPIPCPVIQNPGGEPLIHQEPCTQRRDVEDPVVTRIYDGNGVMIGSITP